MAFRKTVVLDATASFWWGRNGSTKSVWHTISLPRDSWPCQSHKPSQEHLEMKNTIWSIWFNNKYKIIQAWTAKQLKCSSHWLSCLLSPGHNNFERLAWFFWHDLKLVTLHSNHVESCFVSEHHAGFPATPGLRIQERSDADASQTFQLQP